jgi:GNAT superfamily N-acetyltransferase
MSGELVILRTVGGDLRFVALEAELDAFLTVLNGEKDDFFSALNHAVPLQRAVLAVIGEQPVGCGAFKPLPNGEVEIKRMFVLPEARGGRIGERVLSELLTWARELGYSRAILETHVDLTPARRLYERNGFEVIPNYPPYEEIRTSICYSREI